MTYKKNKIIEISASILIIVVFINIVTSAFYLYEKIDNLKEMKRVNLFLNTINKLLHRTQQERGAGAGYLGNSSIKFKKLYLQKIELTNKAVENFYVIDEEFPELTTQKVKKYLNRLKKVRERVLSQNISLKQEIEFYSKMNATILNNIGKIILKAKNNSKILKNFIAHRNFEMAKERVGIERAILSGVFSRDKWESSLYILYVNLLAEQKILFKLSMELANKNLRKKFLELSKSENFKKIKKIEKIALYKNANFNIDSMKFYMLITQKIDSLNKIAVKMMELNNKTIDNLESTLLIQFLCQFLIDILLVIFLFYTLFLCHDEHKKLFFKSTKDKLTSLYNREFLSQVFPLLESKCKLKTNTITFFFLDLDGFKQINDTYGHEVGDKVLVEVANRLKKIFKKNGIIIRLGGDEFLILVENIDKEMAEKFAKEIIEEISKIIKINDYLSVKVGMSIGISNYPENGNSFEELIKKADEAMYFSKRSGKGRYTFYN